MKTDCIYADLDDGLEETKKLDLNVAELDKRQTKQIHHLTMLELVKYVKHVLIHCENSDDDFYTMSDIKDVADYFLKHRHLTSSNRRLVKSIKDEYKKLYHLWYAIGYVQLEKEITKYIRKLNKIIKKGK